MNLKQTIFALGLLPAITLSAFGQQRGLEVLPQYERYQHIREIEGDLVKGGVISRVTWSEDGNSFEYRIGKEEYRFDLASGTARKLEADEDEEEKDGSGRGRRPRRGRQRDSEPSPDGNWNANCVDWNVVLERADDLGGTITITTDGTRKHRFGKASWVYGEELRQIDAMFWSPDSTKLAYYELDEREVPDFYLIGELNTIRTEAMIEGYPKPGEPNPIAYLWIYDLESGETIKVQTSDDPESYIYRVRFSPNGDELLFNRTNRHQNILDVMAANPETGESRVVLTETQEMWQNNSPEIKFLEDGERFIWETEKTGWKQYELRHIDGRLLHTLTKGEMPAERISRLDEENGLLYYTAYSDDNPLFMHLHRVGLDGKGMTRLTPLGLSHSVKFSDDGQWFISRAETLEVPPTTTLYTNEGNEVATLAESDSTLAIEEGITPPEQFTFKAADGVTDLYGVLRKPSHFDPNRVYPLVLSVYGGPLSKSVRARYRATNPDTEFGVCIVTVENRGTTGRGKAFETAAYLKLGDVDIADVVEGIKHLTKRPYIDGEKVGVYGGSYGGYMSALALTKYPDVFHTAVAMSAVIDWRQYDTIYTERFMRTPEENLEGYDNGSVLTYAKDLRGNLLILHGMVDDNVHPTNIWQLSKILQDEGKSFDMMLYPLSGHGSPKHGRNLRLEYLVRHLNGDRVYSSGQGGERSGGQ